MAIFELGIKILLIFSFAFFLVFFHLCRGWAKPAHPEKSIIIGLFVSGFYTFWIVLVGFLILGLIYLAWRFLPGL